MNDVKIIQWIMIQKFYQQALKNEKWLLNLIRTRIMIQNFDQKVLKTEKWPPIFLSELSHFYCFIAFISVEFTSRHFFNVELNSIISL